MIGVDDPEARAALVALGNPLAAARAVAVWREPGVLVARIPLVHDGATHYFVWRRRDTREAHAAAIRTAVHLLADLAEAQPTSDALEEAAQAA